jgi:hypothetical protein
MVELTMAWTAVRRAHLAGWWDVDGVEAFTIAAT